MVDTHVDAIVSGDQAGPLGGASVDVVDEAVGWVAALSLLAVLLGQRGHSR